MNYSSSSASDNTSAGTASFDIQAPSLGLPKGGGAIRGLGDKFSADLISGAGQYSIPVHASPGRAGFGPQLSLAYSSAGGNTPFGFGWTLSIPSITRKTDKGLPRYDDDQFSDIFLISGAEDLMPVLAPAGDGWAPAPTTRSLYGQTYQVQAYRPRTEGLFALIERWANASDAADVFWRAISKDNLTSWYGLDAQSRIADPADPGRIFE